MTLDDDPHMLDVTQNVLLIPPFRLTPAGRIPQAIRKLCESRGFTLPRSVNGGV